MKNRVQRDTPPHRVALNCFALALALALHGARLPQDPSSRRHVSVTPGVTWAQLDGRANDGSIARLAHDVGRQRAVDLELVRRK